MPIVPLSIERIELGGLIEEANAKLMDIAKDCAARPFIADARVVNISISLKPRTEPTHDHGVALMTDIDWIVKHKVPGRSGMTTRAFFKQIHGEQLPHVNTGDPLHGNPDQLTLDDFTARKEEPRPE